MQILVTLTDIVSVVFCWSDARWSKVSILTVHPRKPTVPTNAVEGLCKSLQYSRTFSATLHISLLPFSCIVLSTVRSSPDFVAAPTPMKIPIDLNSPASTSEILLFSLTFVLVHAIHKWRWSWWSTSLFLSLWYDWMNFHRVPAKNFESRLICHYQMCLPHISKW